MIPFEFKYYKPESVESAIDLFDSFASKGKKAIYYGGGTEFISMARMNNVYADAVIDIKGIPECNVHELEDHQLIIGSAVTLTEIADLNLFPLLSLIVKRIADHTIQGKITLGGNLAGTIIYREAMLPLMLSNSEVVIADIKGKRRVPIMKLFDKGAKLEEGEMIVQVIIKEKFLSLPYLHVKKTKNEKIDYPLITLAALKDKKGINIAFSGLYEYPTRSRSIENILNDSSISVVKRANRIIEDLPGELLNDLSGSSEYRKFMLHTMLCEAIEKLEEGK